MSRLLKVGAVLLGLLMAIPAIAGPLGAHPKKAGKHPGKTIPARHNAGHTIHG